MAALVAFALAFFLLFQKKKLFLFAVIPNSIIFAPDFLKITQINTNITRNNGDIH